MGRHLEGRVEVADEFNRFFVSEFKMFNESGECNFFNEC